MTGSKDGSKDVKTMIETEESRAEFLARRARAQEAMRSALRGELPFSVEKTNLSGVVEAKAGIRDERLPERHERQTDVKSPGKDLAVQVGEIHLARKRGSGNSAPPAQTFEKDKARKKRWRDKHGAEYMRLYRAARKLKK